MDEWKAVHRRRQVAFGPLPETECPPIVTAEERDDAVRHETTGEAGPENQTACETQGPEETERPKDLVGLALSGGGLRSAFFNDGLLQALSHRGFLRYVDFLSSVSGGGYIAGHLMTHARKSPARNETAVPDRPDDSVENFHADRDPAGAASDPVWYFGRDPETGREDPQRLPGIGAYLRRSFRFFAGYALRQLPIFLLYLSFVGLVSALLAIGFRSYDAPLFRSLYVTVLGVKFGNEFLIAFIPTLLVLVSTLVLALIAWLPWRLPPHGALAKLQDRLKLTAKCGFWLTLVMAAISCAVFLGNDLTKATSDATVASHHRLNQFALQMTLLAAAVQLLVFMGSDRLLRSEQSESAKWKKTFQAVVSNGVVAFAIFTMIHVMARENLSGYTHQRDPALVTGDVADWRALATVFAQHSPHDGEGTSLYNRAEIAKRTKDTLATLDLATWSEQHLLGISRLFRHDRLLFDSDATAIPDSPLSQSDRTAYSQQTSPSTLLSPVRRLWYALRACLPLVSHFPLEQPHSLEAGGDPFAADFVVKPLSTTKNDFESICGTIDQAHANASRYLHHHNALLYSKGFTEQLFRLLTIEATPTNSADAAKAPDAKVAKPDAEAILKSLMEHPLLARNLESMASSHQTRLYNLLKLHFLGSLGGVEANLTEDASVPWKYRWAIPESTSREDLRAAVDRGWLNLFLLSLLTSGEDRAMLRPFHVASTWVVQPHDQRSRWRWVVFWSGLLSVCLILTANLNRNHYLFDFYHQQISGAFLQGKPSHIDGDTPVTQMRPWENGLPFPIYLMAGMIEKGDGRGIVPLGIGITPLGATLGDEPRYQRALDSFGDPVRSEVTLAKAVATSGAAITPLMTNSLSLRLLMDFFGARLGYRMRFVDPNSDPPSLRNKGLTLPLVCLGLVAAVYFFGLLLPLALQQSLLALGVLAALLTVATIILWQVYRCSGYPALCYHWLSGLRGTSTVPPPQSDEADSPDAERSAPPAADSRPGMFVADGGFYDYLGVSELLRRRCELIVVSDAGINRGSTTMEALASMCEQASAELGVRFVQLDHDLPIEYARLQRDENQAASQTFLAMRVKYPEIPDRPELPREGILFYVQMSITDRDPIEIQQIRHRFPSFPDEPTTNQFYTPEQVAAYRDLGHHIGNRLCNHLHRWDSPSIWDSVLSRKRQIQQEIDAPRRRDKRPSVYLLSDQQRIGSVLNPKMPAQPLFRELRRRLVRSYVQACYEEHFYSEDDVFGESVWRHDTSESLFPTFATSWQRVNETVFADNSSSAFQLPRDLTFAWLDEFQRNADVFTRYMEAVNLEVNRLRSDHLDDDFQSPCCQIAYECLIAQGTRPTRDAREPVKALLRSDSREFVPLWTAHLAVVAAAAQQLHRGSPHQVFQVGGREKLSSVIEHLAGDIIKGLDRYRLRVDTLSDQQNGDIDDTSIDRRARELLAACDDLAEALIHETYELSESVFQGADRIAVVSFTQCLCSELASAIRLLSWGADDDEQKLLSEAVGRELQAPRTSDFHADDSKQRIAKYSLPLDFRQLMFDKLQSGYRSQAKTLLAAYLRFLCTGIREYGEETPVVPQRILNASTIGTSVKRPRKG
ncbi:MAG: hypothetical protein EA381_03290 [Planctomycetaceae bacterium]|nr:MAG: hypothetical protein EA381_03290 [Planctomycetaceae bacterium]